MSLADFAAAFAYLPPLGNDAANIPPVIEQGMCEAKGECCLFKRQKCTLRWDAEALQVCLCLFVLFLSICQSACASSLPVPPLIHDLLYSACGSRLIHNVLDSRSSAVALSLPPFFLMIRSIYIRYHIYSVMIYLCSISYRRIACNDAEVLQIVWSEGKPTKLAWKDIQHTDLALLNPHKETKLVVVAIYLGKATMFKVWLISPAPLLSVLHSALHLVCCTHCATLGALHSALHSVCCARCAALTVLSCSLLHFVCGTPSSTHT